MAAITEQQLENASVDAKVIEDFANGAADINGTGLIPRRLTGPVKSLDKLISDIADVDIGDAAAALINQRIDALSQQTAGAPRYYPDAAGNLSYELDGAGRVISFVDRFGKRFSAGNPYNLSDQAMASSPSERSAAPGSLIVARTDPRARYIMAGTPRNLLPNPDTTSLAGYPFDWTNDPVNIQNVRRARGSTNGGPWQLDALTLNEGPLIDYSRVHQIRDMSVMRDRMTGNFWIAVNSIQRGVTGYTGSHWTLAQSDNGLGLNLRRYIEIPIPTMQVWSPEWFPSRIGEPHVIVAVNKNPEVYNNGDFLNSLWGYHVQRCVDLETGEFEYLGEMTGKAFPRMIGGANPGEVSMIDPFAFCPDGYVVIWKAETAKGIAGFDVLGETVPYGTLGYAVSENMMGPYDKGAPFKDQNGAYIRGEGQHLIQLPGGGYRLIFDDFTNDHGGGMRYADTTDLVTFGAVLPLGLDHPYDRHTTFVPGLLD